MARRQWKWMACAWCLLGKDMRYFLIQQFGTAVQGIGAVLARTHEARSYTLSGELNRAVSGSDNHEFVIDSGLARFWREPGSVGGCQGWVWTFVCVCFPVFSRWRTLGGTGFR